MSPDHRDMALEHFALVEAELLERIDSLECDVAAYRVLACESLAALSKLTTQYERLRETQFRLLEELGYLRAKQQTRSNDSVSEAA
jgi:hypothetical protein